MRSRDPAEQLRRLKALPPEKRAAMARLLKQEGIELGLETGTERGIALSPRARDAGLALSFDQRRIWFLHHLDPHNAALNVHANVMVAVPVEVLERAFNDVIARHEILRTTYRMGEREPVQVIGESKRAALEVVDFAHLADDEAVEPLVRRMKAERDKAFDLASGPVWRAFAARLSNGRSVLALTVHHIATDGWSMNRLAAEIRETCDALANARAPRLPDLPLQYADFAAWQRERLQGKALDDELAYWRDRLRGMPQALGLITDFPRPAMQTNNGSSIRVDLPEALAEGLRKVAQRHQATFFMALLALYKVLLARNTGQYDVVVGTPIAGRSRPELEHVHGLFLNSLVLRTDLGGDPSFGELLARVRDTVLGAFAHEDVPFDKIVEDLQPPRDLSRNPLFQAFFTKPIVDQEFARPERASPVEGAASAREGHPEFDIGLWVEEYASQVQLAFHFNADLFEAATAERWAAQYLRLAEAVVADDDARIGALDLQGKRERERVLREWNATREAFDEEAVSGLFERRVREAPHARALEFEGEALDYGELDARANRLARHLRSLGVGPETKVAIHLERGIDMVVAVLAVMKAGGAYVPLDPAYPRERLQYMLADSQARVLVTQDRLRDTIEPGPVTVVRVDGHAEAIAAHESGGPGWAPRGGDLAYMIYTSGSTGQPKGVQVEHRSLTNFACAMARSPGMAADDVLVAVTTLSFDIAGLELYVPLVAGASVVLASRETAADGAALARLLERSGATVLQATPATWRLLLAAGWKGSPGLKALCGGEAMPRELAELLLACCGEVWNLYGPTETTIWSAACRVRTGRGAVPIGRPIANTQLYVLDERREPVPVGAAGELYIGGAGVARGYRGQEALTAERFVADPFAGTGRLYRTGDRARYLADGQLEYLGREDAQVKLRGFRIELGEVESVLERVPGVAAAVATVREDRPGDQRLVGYVVRSPGSGVTAEALREAAARRLPGYMVPTTWVFPEALPLTPNGKVDRKALPASGTDAARPIVAPRSEIERRIAAIWKDVLGTEQVGVQDNFFDLGGHSMLLVLVQSRLREAFGVELPVVELFERPTIEALAERLGADRSARSPTHEALARGNRRGAERRERRSGRGDAAVEEIAVIGLDGRFPGAGDPAQFWAMLRDGREGITFFDDAQLLASGVDPALVAHPDYVKAKGFASDLDLFDAPFFGYSPADAESLDPQHRVFMQCAWSALERAGYDPGGFDGAIGVYAAESLNTYSLHGVIERGDTSELFLNDKDYLATRVSYKLDLRGPSMTVQTACSSSLVALAEACESLLDHRCDIAIAGGVSVGVPLASGHLYQEGGIGSRDGHCRAFDAASTGCVSGDGAGVVVLKRLSEALADRDTVLAVIKGAAVNNDGAGKVGFTAPSIAGQAEVISNALAAAGVEADTIGYVEAHGTGTILGDPIEMAALTQAFRARTDRRQYCAVGSVKTNIGHLDAAAGIAGFIKTVLCLGNAQIPPSLHFAAPNPKIDFAGSPFYVSAALGDWKPPEGVPRRAGVSSFGLGGTNAHVIVEEAAPVEASNDDSGPQLLLLSARTPAALQAAADRLAAHLEASPGASLADVAFTLQVGRKAFAHRRIAVCDDIAGAVAALRAAAPAQMAGAAASEGAGTVFMFSGQGAQYPNMSKGLYAAFAPFRSLIDHCARRLEPHLGLDLRTLLYPAPGDEEQAANRLRETRFAQPALFAVEYAMARLWQALGVEPQAMIGHSLGEYVAACVADVIALDDALALVALRGRLMQAQPAGAMLGVPLGEEAAGRYLSGSLCVAAGNAPGSCVVSGPLAEIDALQQRLAAEGHEARRLQTSHAFHSSMMDPVVDALAAAMRGVRLAPPRIPYVSNVTGEWIRPGEAVDPAYWGRHVRACVRFSAGVATLLAQSRLFLELGPGNTLCTFVAAQAAGTPVAAVPSIRHPRHAEDDARFLLGALGRAWIAGARCDWAALHGHERRRRVPLPTYPFEARRFWFADERKPRAAMPLAAPVRRPDVADWFHVPLWRQLPPPATRAAAPGSKVLLFRDETGLGAALAARLGRDGHEVVTVRIAERFERRARGAYAMDPAVESHYEALFEALAAEGGVPPRVVDLWPVCAPGVSHDRLLELCFWSPTGILRSLGRAASPFEVAIVSNEAHDVLGGEAVRPEKATLLGPCRVAPQEWPHIACRHIDVALEGAAHEALATRLADELLAPPSEPGVALRGRHRWTEVLEPLRIEAPQGAARLRRQGVYLVTGGLGGIGLAIADELARSSAARLVLVSRTALPERAAWDDWLANHSGDDRTSRALRAIRSLEAAGAEVLVAAADVADAGQMRSVVAQARARWGDIHGVVHAAGIPAGGLIELRKRPAMEAVLAAKVRGTRVLEEALGGQPLDFMVLCSSITATLPTPGQVDYTAANAFLDAFAQSRSAVAGGPTVSIAWDAWGEVGMAVETQVPAELAEARRRELAQGIRTSEGVEVFRRALASAQPRLVISTSDLQARLAQRVPREQDATAPAPPVAEAARHERPALADPAVAPRSETEAKIAAIWEELFKVKGLGIHDNFFELGGHSLLAIQGASRVRAAFGIGLSLDTFLELATIERLASHVDAARWTNEQREAPRPAQTHDERDEFEV